MVNLKFTRFLPLVFLLVFLFDVGEMPARSAGVVYDFLGNPYDTNWPTISDAVIPCCPPNEENVQRYSIKIQGINYNLSPGGFLYAPCETGTDAVTIAADYGWEVDKFAFRYDVYLNADPGVNECPTAPKTRWIELEDSGGKIQSSPWIYLFEKEE